MKRATLAAAFALGALTGGGATVAVRPAAPDMSAWACRRWVPDAGACTLSDGGSPSPFARLRSKWLTGPGCQPVQCSVPAGTDPNGGAP